MCKYYCPFDGKELTREELFIDIGIIQLYKCSCGTKLKIIGKETGILYLLSKNDKTTS